MSASMKVGRAFGAILVTLALVPWLGIAPAAATGGGDKGSHSSDKSDGKSGNKGGAKSDTNPEHASSSGNQKMTLCHRTNSDHNPYVRITVSINSVIKGSGHDGHNGPVYAAGMKAAHQKWGDIIPSFTYTTKSGSTASYGGKNWPAGRAIFDAGCAVSHPTSTPSVSHTESTSVTPTESESPTDTTSVSPTSTQTVTTTVTGSDGTVTVTQTVSGETSVLPTKIGRDDGDNSGVGGTGVLAGTGLDLPLGVTLGLSFLLLLAGGALLVMPARLTTERNRRH